MLKCIRNPRRERNTFLGLKGPGNCCGRVSNPTTSVERAAPLDTKLGSIFSRIAGECTWRLPVRSKLQYFNLGWLYSLKHAESVETYHHIVWVNRKVLDWYPDQLVIWWAKASVRKNGYLSKTICHVKAVFISRDKASIDSIQHSSS